MAVAPPGRAPATDPAAREARFQLFGIVREIRAEVQNLQEALALIPPALESPPSARAEEVGAALRRCRAIFDGNIAQLDDLVEELRVHLRLHSELRGHYGDEIIRVGNYWARVKLDWPALDADRAGLAVQTRDLDALLHDIVYHCGVMTIPDRVNAHLRSLRIGRPFNFAQNFSDELPEAEDRRRLLDYMHSHPLDINGTVDIANGIIYHASHNPLRRAFTYLAIAVMAAAGVGFVYVLAHLGDWLDLSGWPIDDNSFEALLGAYIFLLFGAVAHIIVDALKQSRSTTPSAVVAVDDWPTWIHVKYISLVTGIGMLWLGLIGLVFIEPLTGNIEWETAFFVGYSIDSFIDLFLQRFTAVVDRGTQAVTTRLSATPANA